MNLRYTQMNRDFAVMPSIMMAMMSMRMSFDEGSGCV